MVCLQVELENDPRNILHSELYVHFYAAAAAHVENLQVLVADVVLVQILRRRNNDEDRLGYVNGCCDCTLRSVSGPDTRFFPMKWVVDPRQTHCPGSVASRESWRELFGRTFQSGTGRLP